MTVPRFGAAGRFADLLGNRNSYPRPTLHRGSFTGIPVLGLNFFHADVAKGKFSRYAEPPQASSSPGLKFLWIGCRSHQWLRYLREAKTSGPTVQLGRLGGFSMQMARFYFQCCLWKGSIRCAVTFSAWPRGPYLLKLAPMHSQMRVILSASRFPKSYLSKESRSKVFSNLLAAEHAPVPSQFHQLCRSCPVSLRVFDTILMECRIAEQLMGTRRPSRRCEGRCQFRSWWTVLRLTRPHHHTTTCPIEEPIAYYSLLEIGRPQIFVLGWVN